MFSRRSGSFFSAARGGNVSSSNQVSRDSSESRSGLLTPGQRRLTALSLAVTSVMQPLMVLAANKTPTPTYPVTAEVAADANFDAAMIASEAELLAADNETLRQATDQFKAGDYEEAAATLAGIKQDDLSASDRTAYDRLNTRVTEAVEGRKSARASFEKGESALADKKYADAIHAYKDAQGNKFVDRATRVKAAEQIALVETEQRNAAVVDKATYAEARELLDKGELDAAKSKFQTLADHGYKAGLFQPSPSDLLARIARQQGTTAAAPVTPAAPAAPEMPATPAGPSAADAYNEGVKQFRAKDYDAARKSFEAAKAGGYRTGMFERSPDGFLKLINEATASAAPATPAVPAMQPETPATPAAPAAPATPPMAAAPETPATPATPPAASMEPTTPAAPAAPSAEDTAMAAKAAAEASYEAGVKQFRAGDLDAAEKSFTAARDGGYKAGMFQDSPERWLRRVETRRTEIAAAASATTREAAAKAERDAMDAKRADARKAYTSGRDAYRAGDWNEARKQFTAAQDMGYKAGLFEDSPSKYLARMDSKEQADAAKTMAQATPAPMPVAPMTPTTPTTPIPEASPGTAEQTPPSKPTMGAEELVTQARAAQASGDNAKALDLYTKALAADPNNAAAKAGHDELAAMAPTAPMTPAAPGDMAAAPATPAAPSLLDRAAADIQARRQVVQYEFNNALTNANTAIASNNFDAARQAILQARTARSTDATIFTPGEIAAFDSDLGATESRLNAAIAMKATQDAEITAQRNVSADEARRRDALDQRNRTITALIKQARSLVEETKYQEAVNVLDQIIAIDPTNDYALGVRPLVEDRAAIQQQRRYRENYQKEMTKQFTRAQEIQVPYDDVLRYPENWPDISALRDADSRLRRGETAEDRQTQAILSKKLPELRLEGVAFQDVLSTLQELNAGVRINPAWREIEAAGVDRTAPINVGRVTGFTLKKALQIILKEAGGQTALDFYVDEDGVVNISTKEIIARAQQHIVVYDVSDLLFKPLNAGQAPNAQFQLQATQRGGGGGGNGNQLFGNQQNNNQQQDQTTGTLLTDLTTQIQTLVGAPEDWSTQGGPNSISQFNSGSSFSLIVNASSNIHNDLDRLLNKLRSAQAVQVSVEARFLTVQRSYLEDVGLDLDVSLNTGGVISPKFGSRTGANGAFSNNIPISQNSYNFTANPRTGLPSGLSGTDTNVSPALGLQGTFLDDFSVDFLIRATQASTNSSQAQAPRLTLFSGQRATVTVGTFQYFVTDLTPIVGTGAVAFQPNPSAVFSGVTLWVEAVVSADRKYVQLNLVPQLTQLTGVQNFVFQTAAQQSTTGGPLPTGAVTPVAGIATATIQLPTQAQTQILTSASVPDGGTILLGGLTQGGEVENEMGVPILSKIPFLKRLFTNRSTATDETVLLILVKPTIIIQHEVEERSFPLLSNRTAP